MGSLLGLCTPDSHRGSIKPEIPEALTWCAAGDILLPEGPLSWNPSDLICKRPSHSLCGAGGGVHSFTGGCVGSPWWWTEFFFSCWPPLRRAKVSVQQAWLYTRERSRRDAQCGEPEGLEEKIALSFLFFTPWMYPSNAAEPTNRYHLREPSTRGLLVSKLGAVLSCSLPQLFL